jgi:hypothetical protein
MKPLHRLALLDSLLAILVCPVPLLCKVLIRFAEAKLSLLSGLQSGRGPDDLVLGKVKWATGIVVCGMAVEAEATELLTGAGLSLIEGITRLVRIE